jgi:hypothetical protein
MLFIVFVEKSKIKRMFAVCRLVLKTVYTRVMHFFGEALEKLEAFAQNHGDPTW